MRSFSSRAGILVAPVALCAVIAATISCNTTRIGCETGSDNPNTIMLVTPNWNSPGAKANNNHPIAVYHIGNTWYDFNQDIA